MFQLLISPCSTGLLESSKSPLNLGVWWKKGCFVHWVLHHQWIFFNISTIFFTWIWILLVLFQVCWGEGGWLSFSNKIFHQKTVYRRPCDFQVLPGRFYLENAFTLRDRTLREWHDWKLQLKLGNYVFVHFRVQAWFMFATVGPGIRRFSKQHKI